MTVLPSGSLEITNVNYPDRGTYNCVVGGLVSRAADLNLKALIANADPEAPEFLTSPRSVSVMSGNDVTMECSANGLPQPTITWLKDGRELDLELLDNRYMKTGSGSLTIMNVRPGDEGGYQCRAENTEDSVDSGLVLTVTQPPLFVKKPVSHLSYEKDDILFDCEVTGRPEPEVRWYKNGDLIIQSEYFQVHKIFLFDELLDHIDDAWNMSTNLCLSQRKYHGSSHFFNNLIVLPCHSKIIVTFLIIICRLFVGRL